MSNATELLQLADSAFPAGAFAHSGGLEALKHLGVLRGEAALSRLLTEVAWHTAHSALPFVNEAHGHDPVAADVAAEVFLLNHVARRASIAQGGALLMAAQATLVHADIARVKAALPFGHFAVAWAAVLRRIDRSLDQTREVFLFGAVRSALSSAVRLGVVGPLRAQGLLWGLHPTLANVLGETAALRASDATSTAPWLETAQMGHDRLYSRLFQS